MYLSDDGVLPKHVQRELRVLRALHHPGVVTLHRTLLRGFSVALVLEHCLTDLRHLLAALRGTPLDAAVAKAAAQQLLAALAALHGAGFVHRDVAPSNLLVSREGALKLADFGQARRLPGARPLPPAALLPAGDQLGELANGISGSGGDAADDALTAAAPPGSLTPGACLCTRWYKAPELLFNGRDYGAGVDMWSAGCIIAELLTGRPLFPGGSDIGMLAAQSELLGSISEERWPGVLELPDWGKLIFEEQAPKDLGAALGPAVPPEAVQLLAGLLQYNPELRPTAQEALRSPWFEAEPAPAPPAALLAIARQALD
ncbi:cyclin-dependent kinase 20 [Micractinium conductrix]|uniref:cyclin-dependent kinase n=1 Tax=Micractinium conductrix TaxID=554055 RepID=A0A2P6V688_9CHLO|nr:cyclin-dependent kinase 20 [Micractinium conductrix]|eukprot:PSC69602.1 cyclin-dependent kinase 20 [Micractinium conductrix]